jgi:hypothetical protein
MKHTLKNQAKRAGIALAGVAAFMAFGAGTALAAPPPPTGPTFASASITIEPRGEEAGGLTCSWRETGLGSYAQITYDCSAQAVGVVEGCFVKNRLVSNSLGPVEIFKNVTSAEAVAFMAKANGAINGTTTTTIPEASEGGGEPPELCTEPAVAGIVAIRWCNASLVDTTTPLVGATVGELFQEFAPGAVVPTCAVLLAP